MSVVVIGMEMPRGCLDCFAFTGQGCWIKKELFPDWFNVAARPKSCPIRPLPEKHERLIDANALHLLLERRWHDLQILDWDENPHAEDIQTGVNWCLNTLHDDAPTIIEAEGGSDE